MPSYFGWVDLLEEHKEKMHEMIKVLSESEPRDELGIGSVRGAFSNLFFPGTSTIQRRVKYMLFIPWIFQEIEERRVPTSKVEKVTRKIEAKLIDALLESDDTEGVIGRDSRENLQRMPSGVYWSGLKRWGILNFDGSQASYYRGLSDFYTRSKNRRLDDDLNPLDQDLLYNWDPNLPRIPDEFPDQANFALTKEEADYLRDKIKIHCKGSLIDAFIDFDEPYECDFVWEHPDLHKLDNELINYVKHAEKFSFIIYGAALLYNLMLSAVDPNLFNEKEEMYREEFSQWREKMSEKLGDYQGWDRDDFWKIVTLWGKIHPRTKEFIDRWIDIVLNHLDQLPEYALAQKLIIRREDHLKGARARLSNHRYLEIWNGAAGASQLTFRWGIANSYINDIIIGLKRGVE